MFLTMQKCQKPGGPHVIPRARYFVGGLRDSGASQTHVKMHTKHTKLCKNDVLMQRGPLYVIGVASVFGLLFGKFLYAFLDAFCNLLL